MASVNDFDLRLLKVFDTVVQCHGYAGAQARLNVSQSTLSSQMTALEQRLGLRLCQRGRVGFRLTEKGAAVHDAAEQLFAAVQRFQAEVAAQRGRLAGTLRVGLVDHTVTNPTAPLHRVIERFDRRDHQVRFDLTVAEPQQLEQAVLDGKLHLAIGPFARKREALTYQPLFAERHLLYCARGHRLFPKADQAITKAELGRAQFVARSYMHGADLRKAGLAEAAAQASNMEAQAILILSGDYIGFLPDHYARPWQDSGELRPLKSKRLAYSSRFSLIARRGLPRTEVMEAFVEDLMALLKEARS
ncbi:MAG: LysR family transcriptional regulator [Pseudomonadota bacterium]